MTHPPVTCNQQDPLGIKMWSPIPSRPKNRITTARQRGPSLCAGGEAYIIRTMANSAEGGGWIRRQISWSLALARTVEATAGNKDQIRSASTRVRCDPSPPQRARNTQGRNECHLHEHQSIRSGWDSKVTGGGRNAWASGAKYTYNYAQFLFFPFPFPSLPARPMAASPRHTLHRGKQETRGTLTHTQEAHAHTAALEIPRKHVHATHVSPPRAHTFTQNATGQRHCALLFAILLTASVVVAWRWVRLENAIQSNNRSALPSARDHSR